MKKYFKQLKANKKGFTLIEMIVVIAIIGVLAAILVPSISGYLRNAKDTKKEANVKTIYTAAQAAVTSLEGTSPVPGTSDVPVTYSSKDDDDTGLFAKIINLIGESNYNKFDTIEVEVADGAVTKVSVIENAGDDAITYPSTPDED